MNKIPISQESRERYHPDIDSEGVFHGGARDYLGRFHIIEKYVDFHGKRVLDLGCSGGFFTFMLAGKAAEIVAVDADSQLIDKNRRIAQKLNLTNIIFEHAEITPDYLDSLGKFDVVLFLSVFHHMISSSSTYEWTANTGKTAAMEIIQKIRRVADILVFEIGRPDEGYRWCKNLNDQIGEPSAWVPKNIFGSEFKKLIISKGPACNRTLLRQIPGIDRLIPSHRWRRRALKLLNIDIRDFREIYIGFKNRSPTKND